MSAHDTAVQILAQFPGGQGADFGKSSPVGLLLLVLFGISIALLVRSMSKHLKKLSTSFDEEKALAAAPARVQRAESARAAERADAGGSGDEADGSRGADSEPAPESTKD